MYMCLYMYIHVLQQSYPSLDSFCRYNFEALQQRMDEDQLATNPALLAALQQTHNQQGVANSATHQGLDFSSYQVSYILNSLSSCIHQTRVLHGLQSRNLSLDQKYAGNQVPPHLVQLEIESLKKDVRNGYSSLAQAIKNTNKLIEEFNSSPASQIPHYTESIRKKSRELHDELEKFKQTTSPGMALTGSTQVNSHQHHSSSMISGQPNLGSTHTHVISGPAPSSSSSFPLSTPMPR